MRSLILSALIAAAGAVEGWRPAEHPAVMTNEIPGVTRPLRSLELRAEVAGRVLAVPLAEGAEVADGGDGWSLAVAIDPRSAELARDAALAGVREAEVALTAARAEHALARREAEHLATEQARSKFLFTDGRMAQREYDEATFRADRAQLAVAPAAAAVDAAEAAIGTARVRVAAAENRLARYTVAAPAGWVVAERLVEPGAVVQPGTPLLRLQDVRTLEVALRLSEAEIAALGERVPLRFTAFDREVEATVARIDLGFDPSSRKRQAILHVPGDAAPAASGGLVVAAQLTVPMSGGAVMVPSRYLVRGPRHSYVQLLDGERVPVVPLREVDDMLVLAGDALPADAELHLPLSARR